MIQQIFGFLALISLCLPGFLLARLILRNKYTGESWGLSFLLGSGIFTLVLFISNYFLAVNINIISAWLIFGSFTLFLAMYNPGLILKKLSLTSWTGKEKILLSLLCWLIISPLITSFTLAITDWDAVTLFDFRAKVILNTGWIKDTLPRASVVSYPLLTSLLHFWAYVNGLWTAMPIYPLFLLAFILTSYFLFRRVLSRFWSLILCLALVAAPKIFDQSVVAYTNMPYSVYLTLGAVYIYFWTKTKAKSDLIMGVVLSLLSLWVRSFPFALINLLVPVFYTHWFRPGVRSLKPVILIGFVICLLGTMIQKNFFPVINFLKWSVIEYYFPFPLIFVILTIINFRKKNTDWFWPLVILGYLMVLIGGILIMSSQSTDWFINPDAIQRMVIFLNLIALFFLGFSLR